MSERRYDAVIVGAGIAGLTAGWTLADRDILVLEASERVGGRMRSEPRGPYWLNLGAHLFGGPGTLLDRLVTEMGLETRPIPGNRMGLAFRSAGSSWPGTTWSSRRWRPPPPPATRPRARCSAASAPDALPGRIGAAHSM